MTATPVTPLTPQFIHSTHLQTAVLKAYQAIQRDLVSVAGTVGAAITSFGSISTTPTALQKATLVEALETALLHLPANKQTLYNEISNILDIIELEDLEYLVGETALPSTGPLEHGEVTFSTIAEEVAYWLGQLVNPTPTTIANTIITYINAGPATTVSQASLIIDIEASLFTHEICASELVSRIITNLNYIVATVPDNNGGPIVEAAIFNSGTIISATQVALLADLKQVEILLDLAELKADLIAAFTNHQDTSAHLAAAVVAVFANNGLENASLTEASLQHDIDVTLETVGSPNSLSALAADIIAHLTNLDDTQLTPYSLENAIYSHCVGSHIIQLDSIASDVSAANIELNYLAVKTALLANLVVPANLQSASALASAILNAYSSFSLVDTLTLVELEQDINDTLAAGGSLAGIAANIIAELNLLDDTAGHEINAVNLRDAIFNSDLNGLFTDAKLHLYNDVLAAETYVNYDDVIEALETNLSADNFNTTTELADAIFNAYDPFHTNLSAALLENDIAETLIAKNETLNGLAETIIDSLEEAEHTAASIKDAIYSNLVYSGSGLMTADITEAESLLNVVTYKVALEHAIKSSSLYSCTSTITTVEELVTAINALATAMHDALSSTPGYTHTLTANEIAASFFAGFYAKFGDNAGYSDLVNLPTTLLTTTVNSKPWYEAFTKGLYDNLHAISDNSITVSEIVDALFGANTVSHPYHLQDADKLRLAENVLAEATAYDLELYRGTLVSNLNDVNTVDGIADAIIDTNEEVLDLEDGGSLAAGQLEQDIIAGITAVYGANYNSTHVAEFASSLQDNLEDIESSALTVQSIEAALFGVNEIIQADATQLGDDITAAESLIRYNNILEQLIAGITGQTTVQGIHDAIENVVGSTNLNTQVLLADVAASTGLDAPYTQDATQLAADLVFALNHIDPTTVTSETIADIMYGTVPSVDQTNFASDATAAAKKAAFTAVKQALIANIGAARTSGGYTMSEISLSTAILQAINLVNTGYNITVAEANKLRVDITNSEVPGYYSAYNISGNLLTALNGLSGELTVSSFTGNMFGFNKAINATSLTSLGSVNDMTPGTIYGDLYTTTSQGFFGPYTATGSFLYNFYNSVVLGQTYTTVEDFAANIYRYISVMPSYTKLVTAGDYETDILNTIGSTYPISSVVTAMQTAILASGSNPNVTTVVSCVFGPTGPIVQAPINLLISSNPSSLTTDVTNTEELQKLAAIKAAILNYVDAVNNVNSNYDALAQAIINGVTTPFTYNGNLALSESQLSTDIYNTLSLSITEQTIASNVYNALFAIPDNTLTAQGIANAVYAQLAAGTSSSDASGLAQDITSAAVHNGFGIYSGSGITAALYNALSSATTVSSLATIIIGVLDYIDGSANLASPNLTQSELLADLMFTLNTENSGCTVGVAALANAIATNLAAIATGSADAIEDAIYAPNAVHTSNVDRSNLKLDIDAAYAADNEFAAVKAHIVDALSDLPGAATAQDLAAAILAAVDYISTSTTVPDSDTPYWTPALPSTALDLTHLANDIVATLANNHSLTVTSLAAAISLAVSNASPNANSLVNAIFASNLIILGDADAQTFEHDLFDNIPTEEAYVAVAEALAAVTGDTTLHYAENFISALNYSSSLNRFTSSEVAAELLALDLGTTDIATLISNIDGNLNNATSLETIVNAVYAGNGASVANNQMNYLSSDLTSAVSNTDTYAEIATNMLYALTNAHCENAHELAGIIHHAIAKFEDHTKISTSLTYDDLYNDIEFTLSSDSITAQELATRIESALSGANTAIEITNAIYNSNRVISANPHDLELDLESYAAGTDDFDDVAAHIAEVLEEGAASNSNATDIEIAENIIEGLTRINPNVLLTGDLTGDFANSHAEGANNTEAFAELLVGRLDSVSNTALSVVDAIYNSNNATLAVDASLVQADITAYANSANSFCTIAQNLYTALYGITAANNLANAIVNTITPNPLDRVNVQLTAAQLLVDINFSVPTETISITQLVANIRTALLPYTTGACSATAADISNAIYGTGVGLILASGSDQASLLADICNTRHDMTDSGDTYTEMGNDIHTLLSVGTFSSNADFVTQLITEIDTITSGHVYSGPVNSGNFGADILAAINHAGSLPNLVTALKASFNNFNGTDAQDIIDQFYTPNGPLVVADEVNLLADIIASEASDNQVTVTSMIGSNSIAVAASGTDGSITGLLGNNPLCTAGHTYSFYSCTKDNTDAFISTTLVATNDCTVTGRIVFEEACANWAKQSGVDFYGSYSSDVSGCSAPELTSALGFEAFNYCLAGANHFENVT